MKHIFHLRRSHRNTKSPTSIDHSHSHTTHSALPVHPYLPGYAYPLAHSLYPPVLTGPLAHPPTHSCPHLSSRSGPHRSTTLRGASTRTSSSPEPSTSQLRCYEGDLRPRLTLRITRKALSSVSSPTLIHSTAWTSLRVEPSHVPP